MNRSKRGIIIVVCIAVVAAGIWLAVRAAYSEEKTYTISEALLLRDDGAELSGNYLLVDTENGTPFTGTFPEGNIFDRDGEKISADELKNGDVLKIYGDGIMLESYPGQYPGIGKMELLRRKDQTLLEQYSSLFEETRVVEDPSKLPYLNLEYRQPEAVVCAMVDTYGEYEWSYEDAAGNTVSEKADSPSFLSWERYADINVPEHTKIRFLFQNEPVKLTVSRYPSEAAKAVSGQADEKVQGENVLIEAEEDGSVIDAEPGYVYSVKAQWDNGFVEYGFLTQPMPAVSAAQ